MNDDDDRSDNGQRMDVGWACRTALADFLPDLPTMDSDAVSGFEPKPHPAADNFDYCDFQRLIHATASSNNDTFIGSP